jgi:hypothetical protein
VVLQKDNGIRTSPTIRQKDMNNEGRNDSTGRGASRLYTSPACIGLKTLFESGATMDLNSGAFPLSAHLIALLLFACFSAFMRSCAPTRRAHSNGPCPSPKIVACSHGSVGLPLILLLSKAAFRIGVNHK